MMRCKKCHNEIENGEFVCENCCKKKLSKKNTRSKKLVTRRNEGLEKNGEEIIKKVNKRRIVLFKGLLLFLSGVAIGIGGTISVSNKDAESKTTTADTTAPSNDTEQMRTPQKEKDTQVTKEKEVKKKKTPEKKSSNFTKELPNKIVENVKGLKGYYSYYLHDLSENKGKSGSNKKMLSASTIKLFILETAFSQVKQGKLDLSETYELVAEDKVSGTGDMQNAEEGTPYTNEALLTLMIVDSDNTATNIMIERMGGLEVISDYILDRGYGETVLARKMSDMEAISEGKENYTSVADVGRLMANLASRKLIGKAEDDKMLEILSNGKNHEKLAKHIPDTMTVYCKSGEFSDFGVQNDTVLMEGTEGRYILTIMSEGGDESEQFSVMQDIGKEAYDLILKK